MLVRDDAGSAFDSLDEALQGATPTAAEIGTGRRAKGYVSDVAVEVRNEREQRLVAVTASIRIDRHDPLPQPSWLECP